MSTTNPHADLVTVTIDGISINVPKGTLLVEAAKQIQRDIPVYCYHKKLGPAGLCRICLVAIDGMPKLQIACNTPVSDKMVVHTMGEKVDEGRRSVLELLLLNHPLDCPICDKGGECDLQDYSMAYGQGASRLADAKSSKPKAVDLGPTIVLDEERCILCLRCVRFDDVITQERQLRTDDRGAHAIIATATGQPYHSDFSGNVTELCPVGALTSKTYRFKSRPWDNHRTTTTCTQCSVGCQMHVDQRVNAIARTMSVTEDDQISDTWLCDRGRYNVGYVSDERRITNPLYKHEGEWTQIDWDDAIAMWARAVQETIATHGPGAVGAIGGGRLLNEEAFLLQHVYRSLGVENLDWRAGRQQRAWAGNGTHIDLEDAQVIITFGRTPAQIAPVLDLRIRKAVSHKNALLISVGDHRANDVSPMVRVADFAAAVAAIPSGTQRFALVWDGADGTESSAVTEWMQGATGAGASVATFIVSEQANARGAEAVGMLPGEGGLATADLFRAAREGKIGALALLGVNPLLHFPDRQLAADALRATPFVVVSELFMTETAEFATLILPACSGFEKSGTTTDLAGDLLPVTAAVVSPAGVLADGDMLVALADVLGIALPAPDELAERVRVLVSQPPANLEDVAPAPASLHNGVRVIAEGSIFAGGGTLANDSRLGALRTAPRATFNPVTARALMVAAGDRVDLLLDGSTALAGLQVVVDSRIAEGAVALVDGLPDAPLNMLGTTGTITVSVVERAGAPVLVGASS